MIIPGASHLFEEPGAFDEVARLARDGSGTPRPGCTTKGPILSPCEPFLVSIADLLWVANKIAADHVLPGVADRLVSTRHMAFREYPRLHIKLGSSYRFNGLAFGIENEANSAISVVPFQIRGDPNKSIIAFDKNCGGCTCLVCDVVNQGKVIILFG